MHSIVRRMLNLYYRSENLLTKGENSEFLQSADIRFITNEGMRLDIIELRSKPLKAVAAAKGRWDYKIQKELRIKKKSSFTPSLNKNDQTRSHTHTHTVEEYYRNIQKKRTT